MNKVCLWEILVPTERRKKAADGSTRYYTTRYHRVWDSKVRAITGGLTILPPTKGQWKAPSGDLYRERMIPVRIACTEIQIDEIADMSAEYYDQLAIFYYKVSEEVHIKNYDRDSK